MTPMTIEHLILGIVLGCSLGLLVFVAVFGFVMLRRMKADGERTFRVLGALIVQESEKVQALLRD